MSAPNQPPARGAVFLSYASQDAEAARRVCAALRSAGVEVWFDQNELAGGDAWDNKIRGQVAAGTPGGGGSRALAAIGRPADALAAMDPAKIGVANFSLVLSDPGFDPIRQDPRYVALIAELGLTDVQARARAWRTLHPLPKIK